MKSNQVEFAHIIDTCLDAILSGQSTIDQSLAFYPEHAEELRSFVESALWFEQQKRLFDAPPELKSAHKIRIQKAISTHPQVAAKSFDLNSLLNQFQSLFSRRTLQLAGSLALVIILLFSSTAGFALAAKSAIPGDLLYQSKLSIEKASLFLSITQKHDTELEVEFTNRRMLEIEGLIQKGRLNLLSASIQRYKEQVQLALNQIHALQETAQSEASQIASQLQHILENHSEQFNILAVTLPELYQKDMLLALTITEESITSATEIANQPIVTQPTSVDPETSAPTTRGTPTPRPLPTLATLPVVIKTELPTATLKPSATPDETATLLPLIFPTATPTPTSTPTPILLPTATDDDEIEIIPTKKPTKTPKPRPTRNPHYED
jgi:hypothetical protein